MAETLMKFPEHLAQRDVYRLRSLDTTVEQ